MSSIAAAGGYRSPIYPDLASCSPQRLRNFRNIILIVIDGLGYKYIMAKGAGSLLHDHLECSVTSVFPPTTAAAIPAFLTGNPPQQHGLTGWFTYLKEFNTIAAVLPFAERGSKQPLATDRWGPCQLTNQVPLFERLDASCHSVMPVDIAFSTFNRAFSSGAIIHPYKTLRQMFTTVSQIIGADNRTQYIYAYWPEFDRLAHAFGVSSSQVSRHFELIDAEFTRFNRSIAGTDTIVMVTADHGFVDSDPDQVIRLEDHPMLSETLVMPLSGEPRLAYCYVRDDKKEQFENYIKSELSCCVDVHKSEDIIANNYFGLGTCHPGLSDRVGDYVLVAKDRATIRDRVEGEGPIRDIGVHGGASAEEMYVPLIVLTG